MAQDLDTQIKIEVISTEAQKALESLSKAFKDLKDTAEGVDKPLKKTESTLLQISNGFKSAGESVTRFGQQAESVGKFLSVRFSAAISGIGFLAAKEFGKAEDETFKLNNALRAFGRNTEGSRKLFADLAVEIQKFSRFSAGSVTAAAGLATQFTKSNAATERLVRSSSELATLQGGDLESAVAQLGQTLDGNVGRLAKQYPELNKFSEAQLKAGAAVEYFITRFGGTALESTKTFNGQLIQLKNNVNSFLTVVGESLAPYIQNLAKYINEVVDGLKKLSPETRQQVILFAALGAALGPFLIALGTVAKVVGGALTGFGSLIKILEPLSLIFTSGGAIVAGIVFTVAAIIGLINLFTKLKEAGVDSSKAIGLSFEYLGKFLGEKYFKVMAAGISKLGKVIETIRPAFGLLIQEAAKGLDAVSDKFAGSFEKTRKEIDGLLAPIGETAASAFTNGLSTKFQELQDALTELGVGVGKKVAKGIEGGMVDTTKTLFEQIKEQAETIGETISGNLANAFLDIADGSKSAKDAFKDFAQSALRYIGQLILQQAIFNALQSAAPSFFGVQGKKDGGEIKRKNGGPVGYASGGFVSGAGGPRSDSIAAWLSNGEFVLQASAVKTLGSRFLNGLNQMGSKGGVPAFATGGMVSSGGNGTKVVVENSGSQKQSSGAEIDPTTGVITIFLEDMGKNGPMSKSIQSTYNVKRGGFR